jgi:hypothetical protein
MVMGISTIHATTGNTMDKRSTQNVPYKRLAHGSMCVRELNLCCNLGPGTVCNEWHSACTAQ